MHFCPYPLITRLGCLGGSRRNGRAAHHIVHSLHGLSSMGGFHRLFLSLVSLSTVPVDGSTGEGLSCSQFNRFIKTRINICLKLGAVGREMEGRLDLSFLWMCKT